MTITVNRNMTSVVFIDGSLADLQAILSGLDPSVTAIVLDPAQNGIQQMADALAGVSGLSAIHVISHGASGQINLGAAQLSQDTLAQYQTQLATIGNALSPTGDLLLYGCNVAQGDQGQAFISALASATGADVAASTDFTGNTLLGGNWTLEAATGAIQANTLNANIAGVLAVINGTAGNDTITGTANADWIYGLAGNDTLNGGAGNDYLDGGFGFDIINGGAGIDTTSYAFYAGPIIANLSTGIVQFPGNSTLTDTLISIENIIGTAGNDTITGSDSDNTLNGGNGNDTLIGGLGNDTLDGGFGFDIISGGAGIDTTSYAFYAGPIIANLSTGIVQFPGNSTLTDTLISIENIIGTAGNDTITGNGSDNTLTGGAGNDYLDGGFGFDIIDGGAGIDTTSYAFYAGPIIANLSTGIVQFPGNSTLTDTLISIENIIGTAGNDTITGNDSNNTLTGGNGNDALDGGLGTDKLLGGAGNDTLVYDSADSKIDGGAGSDTLKLGGAGIALDLNQLAANKITGIEKLDLTGSGDNSLLVNMASLLRLTGSAGHSLYVTGDAGDSVSVATLTGAKWTNVAALTNVGGVSYHHYTHTTSGVTDHLYVQDTLGQSLV